MFLYSTDLIFLIILSIPCFIIGYEINLERERSYPTPAQNSPLLPELVRSLARQKNSPETSSTIQQEYDYIVVGGGTAGSVVASRLSELSCVSVLLLEAGQSPPILNDVVSYALSYWNTDLDWQYETTPQKYTGGSLVNRKVRWPAGKGLGGTTILNAGIHVRGNKKDYNDWARMGAIGWSYLEVLPFFKKLEDNRNPEYASDVFYHGVRGPITVENLRYKPEVKKHILKAAEGVGYREVDPNAARQTGFYDLQANLRDGQRCSTAKAYLVPAENRTNLDIVSGAFVTKVIIENGIATGVLFDYKNQTRTVRANREVIVSAGSVRTPQLLMLSGVGPEEELRKFNIPVHANLPVGSNLQDHGGVSLFFAANSRIRPFPAKLVDESSVRQYIRDRSGPVAANEALFAAFLRKDRIRPFIDYPNYEIYFGEFFSQGIRIFANLKPEVYQQVFAPYENRSVVSCFIQDLRPRSRGSITLQSTNPYDKPIINPNYLSDPRDIEDFVQGMRTCYRIYNRSEMAEVIDEPFQTKFPGCEKYSIYEDAYFRCVLRTFLFTLSHYCCTARMGAKEDPRTVVDPLLRVKNVRNLRVADASIMPKLISGNTGIPATMIGEKAAHMIKRTLFCY